MKKIKGTEKTSNPTPNRIKKTKERKETKNKRIGSEGKKVMKE